MAYVQSLMQNYYRVGGLTESSLYILLSSDPTLALLFVGFTEYDDDDDLVYIIRFIQPV